MNIHKGIRLTPLDREEIMTTCIEVKIPGITSGFGFTNANYSEG